MPIMKKITIIIPVEDYDEAHQYYRDVLSFSLHDDLFLLPVDASDVALKLIIVDEKSKVHFPPKKRFPIFCYRLEKNFLSYCKKIYENGALIEMAFATPGEYYARVSDPAGNQFEIECYSFEEDDITIESSTMPSFFKY
jgi:predicted enzyme related to lactoylglutathione lyase